MHSVYLIDDDHIQHFLVKDLLNRYAADSPSYFYFDAAEVLSKIESNLDNPAALPDIILLDINMPVTDGWYFLNAYSALADKISKKAEIYMLSSSFHQQDISRSLEYEFVKNFFVKPLTSEHIAQIFK